MRYHYSSLFVRKCMHTKSSGSVLAVDIALWNINKGMLIPFPGGNYVITANIGWRTNAASNNREISWIWQLGVKKSVNHFWANKKWFYFRFNTQHCREKNQNNLKLHDQRNTHLIFSGRVNRMKVLYSKCQILFSFVSQVYWTTAKIIRNLNSKHTSWPTSNTSSQCITNKEK